MRGCKERGQQELFISGSLRQLIPDDPVLARVDRVLDLSSLTEQCLRQLVRLAKSGGYLFISGVDLDVRSKIARECGLRPLTDLIKEIHEGDSSLRDDWPLRYWGLEPFDQSRIDWKMRYASVFQRAE
jgi:hypothetical protein